MRIKRLIYIMAICIAGAFSGNSWAQPVPELQKKELVLLVNALNNAAERKDASLMVSTMPERLYQAMAARMNISERALRADMQRSVEKQFAQAGEQVYRLDSGNIRYAEAKQGRFYALVPTRIETKTHITEFMTLALFDNTKWHLIYGGQKTLQNPIFVELYPYMADISLPPAQISAKAAAGK